MITKEEIKKYVEMEKNGELIEIDEKNGEFVYLVNGIKTKGFFENVENWRNSLIMIGGNLYHIPYWWKEKNKIEYSLLKEGESVEIKKETEKALLLTNNANTDIWIPKSIMKAV